MLGVNCFCQHCICQENLSGRYDNVTALSIVLCVKKIKRYGPNSSIVSSENRKKEKNRGEKFNACRINFLCTIKHIQYYSIVQRSMRSTRKALK